MGKQSLYLSFINSVVNLCLGDKSSTMFMIQCATHPEESKMAACDTGWLMSRECRTTLLYIGRGQREDGFHNTRSQPVTVHQNGALFSIPSSAEDDDPVTGTPICILHILWQICSSFVGQWQHNLIKQKSQFSWKKKNPRTCGCSFPDKVKVKGHVDVESHVDKLCKSNTQHVQKPLKWECRTLSILEGICISAETSLLTQLCSGGPPDLASGTGISDKRQRTGKQITSIHVGWLRFFWRSGWRDCGYDVAVALSIRRTVCAVASTTRRVLW